MGSAATIGAAIRAARRGADASSRASVRTPLARFAADGCDAASLVLAWFDRDTAICAQAETRSAAEQSAKATYQEAVDA